MKPGRMLITGDGHATPDYDNSRFLRAGELARRFRVTHWLCTGDLCDFQSLLGHGSRFHMEGKRYQADVDAANDALAQADRGLRGYEPEKIRTLGNHDVRPDRRVEEHPELEGKLSWRDVHHEEHGWRCVPWKKVGRAGPFTVTHHFVNRMGRAVASSSVNSLARRIVGADGALGSAIVGHDHRWATHEEESPHGERRLGLVAGVFCHPRMLEESWCQAKSHEWKIRPTIVEWDDRGRVTGLRWEDWG